MTPFGSFAQRRTALARIGGRPPGTQGRSTPTRSSAPDLDHGLSGVPSVRSARGACPTCDPGQGPLRTSRHGWPSPGAAGAGVSRGLGLDGYEATGANIVTVALEAPLKQIAVNAGLCHEFPLRENAIWTT